MIAQSAQSRQSPGRFLIPEVVQTSGMDCGPACLTALLGGFGIEISYARLREACQTDVDGTSIDMLEELAGSLGLDAEQVLLPIDHLLMPESGALPAIVVVRLPNGFAHFVVVWRSLAGRLQIMDPATGRHWAKSESFIRRIFVHSQEVPASAWREWAGTPDFLTPLSRRLRRLGTDPGAFVQDALGDTSWRKLARLDAATRLADSLVETGTLRSGREATALLTDLYRSEKGLIPPAYWFANPGRTADDGSENVILRGAVLVRVLGKKPGAQKAAERASLDLDAVRSEPRVRPIREVAQLVALDGWGLVNAFWVGALAAAAARVLETVLFRGLLNLLSDLGDLYQRFLVVGMVAVLVGIGVAFRFLNERIALGIGRRIEMRLALAFLLKLPRLANRYFRSRPVSDLAERAHSLHDVRQLAAALGEALQVGAQLLITGLAMTLLAPNHAFLIFCIIFGAAALPIATFPLISELDLRMRTFLGALARFQLDSSLGLVAVRSHRAERCLLGEQAGLLDEYIATRLSIQRVVIAIELVQVVSIFVGVPWLTMTMIAHDGASGHSLLLAYWGLINLPLQAAALANTVQRVVSLRNIVLRVIEPLKAPEAGLETTESDERQPAEAAGLELSGVTVVAAAQELLSTVDLRVAAGEHLAIVGPSGAGKSTLVGMFLGRQVATSGAVMMDGTSLSGARLRELQEATAWIDPAVQLWNRSMLENLRYGAPEDADPDWDQLFDECELLGLVSTLPSGLQTPIGEGGGLISGGEGQRIRLGRAMTRTRPRLVILDEPFRGLARGQRQLLLERCRRRWHDVTLLFVTHDIEETLTFDRVLVLEGGRVAECGPPNELVGRDGRFRELLESERQQKVDLWGESRWTTLWMEDGRLGRRVSP